MIIDANVVPAPQDFSIPTVAMYVESETDVEISLE